MRVLRKSEAKIIASFANLVDQVLSTLKTVDIDMERFPVFMANLFPGILQHVATSESVSKYFAYVSDNQLWTYSHYWPVESIAEKFASVDPQVNHLIVNYKRELAAFNATTSLVDYIAKCKDRAAKPDIPLEINYDSEYYETLSLRLNTQVTSKTLEYIDKIWRDIAEFFILPSLSALLDSVVAGSLVITWHIPHDFAMKIREKVRGAEAEEFFGKHDIIEVKLDEEVVYQCDFKVKIIYIM